MYAVRINNCWLYYVRDNRLISKKGNVYINEAVKKYNEINNCSYYYGSVIKCLG